MSAFGDKLKRYNETVSRRSCEIDLEGETIVLYGKPLTGRDIDWLTGKHKKFMENPTANAIADIIIHKAENKDGDKAFDVGDKPVLRGLPLTLLTRIRAELFEDDEDMSDDRVEDDEKN